MPFECTNCGYYIDKNSGSPYECPKCHELGTIKRCKNTDKSAATDSIQDKKQIKCAWCKEVNPPYRKLKEGGYVCDNCYKIIEDHQKQHNKLLVKESREKSQQGKEGE